MAHTEMTERMSDLSEEMRVDPAGRLLPTSYAPSLPRFFVAMTSLSTEGCPSMTFGHLAKQRHVRCGLISRPTSPQSIIVESRRATMMTLSPERRRAIGQAGDQPVPIVDPETHQTYLIIKAEVYDRLRVARRGRDRPLVLRDR